SWTNSAGGNWSAGNNWSTGTMPAPGDDVVIDMPLTGPVKIDVNVTVDATLMVGPNDTVQLMAGKTLTVDGSASLAAGSALTLSAAFQQTTRVLVTGPVPTTGSTVSLSDPNGSVTQVVVSGTLATTNSTFNRSGSVGTLTVGHAGDLVNNRFYLPLIVPA